VSVHVRLPSKQYDLQYKKAVEARLSLADWMRQVLGRACLGKDSGDE
jgi:hypothetical protein